MRKIKSTNKEWKDVDNSNVLVQEEGLDGSIVVWCGA